MPLPSFPEPADPDWNPEPSDKVPEEAIARPLPDELVKPKSMMEVWKDIAG